MKDQHKTESEYQYIASAFCGNTSQITTSTLGLKKLYIVYKYEIT